MIRTVVSLLPAVVVATTAFAQSQSPQSEQTITVGPWTIATTYKGDTFDSCSMSRTVGDLGIDFIRDEDGLSLLLNSPKWKLERGKAYTVRLVSGARAVDAKALAESKDVTITLDDSSLIANLRNANILRVRGEGATLEVPLDGSAAAFERLRLCFTKNSREGVERNPFVAPKP